METSKKTRNVYIGLGSNMGDRSRNLAEAINSMISHDLQILTESSIYESPPWGYTDQPSFLNQDVEIETDHSPKKILLTHQRIEKEMDKKKSNRWNEQENNLDILQYEQKTIKSPDLIIPHQWMHERRFVLAPLAEIAGEYKDPRNGLTIEELLHSTTDKSTVTLYRRKR